MPTPARGTSYQPPPDPIDYLRQAYRGATRSIIPKEWVDPMADWIDSPSLDREPWQARLQGFGAGAVEGLREQLNPLNIVLSAVPGYRAARGAMTGAGAARGLARTAGPVMDVVETAPVRQVMPSMADVDALTGDLTRNLARIRPRPAAPSTSAGTRAAEFTAAGEEGAYNAANEAAPNVAPYGEGFYREMMRKLGGRGPH